jgi:hypothetical protein
MHDCICIHVCTFFCNERANEHEIIYRTAFSEFNPATLANLTDKQMMSISLEYGIDISRVRGVVDNANRILEVNRLINLIFIVVVVIL